MPPMMVRADGISPCTSHTQIGAEHRLQRAQQCGQRGRNPARSRCEAGEAEPEIERAEGEKEAHVVQRDAEAAGQHRRE